MPFIDVRSNKPISRELEVDLKAQLGELVGLIPGKTERYLMLQFTDNCRLWFAGSDDDTAVFVNVMLYGSTDPRFYDTFSQAVIPMLEEKMGAKHVYLKIDKGEDWYWN